jgi:hypothetical protein
MAEFLMPQPAPAERPDMRVEHNPCPVSRGDAVRSGFAGKTSRPSAHGRYGKSERLRLTRRRYLTVAGAHSVGEVHTSLRASRVAAH